MKERKYFRDIKAEIFYLQMVECIFQTQIWFGNLINTYLRLDICVLCSVGYF